MNGAVVVIVRGSITQGGRRAHPSCRRIPSWPPPDQMKMITDNETYDSYTGPAQVTSRMSTRRSCSTISK